MRDRFLKPLLLRNGGLQLLQQSLDSIQSVTVLSSIDEYLEAITKDLIGLEGKPRHVLVVKYKHAPYFFSALHRWIWSIFDSAILKGAKFVQRPLTTCVDL